MTPRRPAGHDETLTDGGTGRRAPQPQPGQARPSSVTRTRVLAGALAVCLLAAASAAWVRAWPRTPSHVAVRLADRLVRPPGTVLWVEGRGTAVREAFRSCDTDPLGSRAGAPQHEVLLALARDHLQPVAVSPGPTGADGAAPPTDPVAVMVAYDLEAGEDLSGSVAVTGAGADCWATALTRLGHPRTARAGD